MATSELAGPDCMRLLRELFGIIVRGLSEDDALALQAALQARRITTEVVDESVLPVLAQPRRVRRSISWTRGSASSTCTTARRRTNGNTSSLPPVAACCISRMYSIKIWPPLAVVVAGSNR